MRPLRILLVSAEVESLARTGGLGDAVEGLARALAALGAHVLLVTPLYGVTRVPKNVSRWPEPISVRVGWGPNDVRTAHVLEAGHYGGDTTGRLRVCLLDDPGLFARNGIYGDHFGVFGDNELRFAALSRGALEVAARAWGSPDEGADAGPDVVHAHDWHTALAVVYARLAMGGGWARRASVFTVHNLAFQGVFGTDVLDSLGIPREAYDSGSMNHFGDVDFMKGAIAYADRATTVSPTYAREIQTRAGGFGLDGFLVDNKDKLVGIVNGIDAARWDPAKDTAIACRYDVDTWPEGKRECKRALAHELGLDDDDGPLFATVARLTWQKGIDLFLASISDLVERGARVVLVGQGDAELEQAVVDAGARSPRRVAVRIAFDPGLARRVYSASDFFLVPSRFEPCGLTQMYAKRYGALPVVTPVGGLADTVTPLDVARDVGDGVVAARADETDVHVACYEACQTWHDRQGMSAAVGRAMRADHSWAPSAQKYLDLYAEVSAARRAR